MAVNDSIAGLLEEELSRLGAVTVRRMFGGRGVFIDGLMFGLIDDDVLFFKADIATRGRFEEEGLEPFTYQRKDGKRTIMSYWRAPDRLFDDADELRRWAAEAIAAARRGEMGKTRSKAAARASARTQPRVARKTAPKSRQGR